MENLTEEQKTKITMEMLREQPLQTVGQIALLKIAEMAVSANSDETTLSTEATFEGKRYKCKMVVTWEEKNVTIICVRRGVTPPKIINRTKL